MFSVKDLTTGRRAGAMAVVTWAVVLALGLTGCASTQNGDEAEAGVDYSELYAQGQYEEAYRAAAAHTRRGDVPDRDEAAYVAGLSAMELGRLSSAERYLRQASRSNDDSLRGDALANLGLLQYRSGRYEAAIRPLTQAAELLTGEDRAQAYFYAGVSQQRLGRWPQARTTLLLARNATEDAALRERVMNQLSVTGYTVQLGAFTSEQNARNAAEQIADRTTELRLGSPRIVPARTGDGRSLTLVHVGTFSSYQSAYDARARLGESSAIIVPLGGRQD